MKFTLKRGLNQFASTFKEWHYLGTGFCFGFLIGFLFGVEYIHNKHGKTGE